MGNGQCPECYGCPESWLGHPLYHTSKELGHKIDCPLAQMLKENGIKPLYKGKSKLTEVYEDYITEQGFLSTRLKTKDGCPELKKINEEYQKEFDELIVKFFHDKKS